MMDKKAKLEKGSYSVEAALIMPIILFVIIALCYMAFYLHDKIRIQSIINSVVLRGGMYLKHESDFTTGEILYEQLGKRGIFYIITDHGDEEKKLLETYLLEQMKEGLIITHLESVRVEMEGLKIEVETSSKVRFPFHKVQSYFSDNGEQMVITSCTQPHNPAEFVRGYTALEEVISETKGFNVIKEKLSKIINVIRQGT